MICLSYTLHTARPYKNKYHWPIGSRLRIYVQLCYKSTLFAANHCPKRESGPDGVGEEGRAHSRQACVVCFQSYGHEATGTTQHDRFQGRTIRRKHTVKTVSPGRKLPLTLLAILFCSLYFKTNWWRGGNRDQETLCKTNSYQKSQDNCMTGTESHTNTDC